MEPSDSPEMPVTDRLKALHVLAQTPFPEIMWSDIWETTDLPPSAIHYLQAIYVHGIFGLAMMIIGVLTSSLILHYAGLPLILISSGLGFVWATSESTHPPRMADTLAFIVSSDYH
ncbi:MAG: hypothetical protein DHS80DRAFT_23682 [Piptocephalis tieghemiana]|nr:MAG: hypothetical protein DHS80DRAFT_23682 [Piptocephalis tieghemiana]